MRATQWLCLGFMSWFGAQGCASDEPTLRLHTLPGCDEAATRPCAEREATRFEVDGIRVLHQRVPGHPLVSMQLHFEVVDEPSGSQLWAESAALGIVNWAGPQRFGTTEWVEELASLSAAFSANMGSDYASIYTSVARPHWKAMWKLLVETLQDPATDAYILEAMQRRYHSSFDAEADDAASAAFFESYARLFAGQAMNLRRETQAAIDRLRRPSIDEAWRALRTKRRLLVVVVGDVKEAEVRALVGRDLAELPDDHAANFAASVPELGPNEPVAVLDYPASPTWHVRAALLGPAANAPDYLPLALGLRVLGARLFDRVRDDAGLAYSAGARLRFYRQSYGQIWLSTPDPQAAFAITREIVAALKSDGPDADELRRSHQMLVAELLEGRGTPADLASSLADWELTSGSFADFDGFVEAAPQITPDEVRDALQRYLRDVRVVAAGSGEPVSEADLATLFE